MSIEYVGGASFYITGQAGMGLGKIATKFRLDRYQGVLLLRFTLDPSPRIQLMLSEMPGFSLSLGYGNQSLGRISRVLILVFKSLLYNHAVFPNYQSLVIRQHAESMRRLFFAPVWRSTRSFIRCCFDSLVLSEDTLRDIPEGSELSCTFVLGAKRYRTEEFARQHQLSLRFQFQTSLPPESDINSLQIVVAERRKRSTKRTLLLTLNVPFSSFRNNMLSSVKISDSERAAFTFRGEVYLSQETFRADLKNPWLAAADIDLPSSAGPTEKYFDGINWGNLKLAWSKFRSASVDDTERSDHLKALLNTLEEPQLEDHPVPTPIDLAVPTAAPSSMLSSAPQLFSPFPSTSTSTPTSASTSASSTSLGDPEMTEMGISFDGFQFVSSTNAKEYHYQGYGWNISALPEQILVTQEYSFSREQSFDEGFGTTMRGSPCSIRITKDLILLQKAAGFRVYDYMQRVVDSRVRLQARDRSADRHLVSFAKGNGEELSLQMSAEEASRLFLWLCYQQAAGRTSVKYQDCRDAGTFRVQDIMFVLIKYVDEGEQTRQLVIPFAKTEEKAADVIVRRICKRAKRLVASGPDLTITLPAAEKPTHELEVSDINGFQVKGLPAPVRISLHPFGIFVRSKIYGSNLVIPREDMAEIVATGGSRRRSCGFSIISDRCPPVEFYKISSEDLRVLESWCTLVRVRYGK